MDAFRRDRISLSLSQLERNLIFFSVFAGRATIKEKEKSGESLSDSHRPNAGGPLILADISDGL